MNKNIYLLVIFFAIFLSKNSYCQKEDKPAYKYGIELSSSNSFIAWTLTPTFTFRKWKHQTIDLGIGAPIFGLPGSRSFSAATITARYKYYPIGKQQKLNFYFHYSLINFTFSYKGFGNSSSIVNVNEHFLGYGFDVPIGKKFYLNSDFGFGFLLSTNNYSDEFTFDASFRLGFGYKFGEKK